MHRLVVVTTGPTADIGLLRAKQAIHRIEGCGALVQPPIGPREGHLRPIPLLSQLVMLGMWGIHHSNARISSKTLRARLRMAHNVPGEIFAKLVSQEVLIQTGSSEGAIGRPLKAYTFSTPGVSRAHLRFSRIFHGVRANVLFNQQSDMDRAVARLTQKPLVGTLIAPSNTALLAAPYRASTLMLITAWALDVAGTEITQPAVAELLQVDTNSTSRAFAELQLAPKYIVPDGKGTRRFAKSEPPMRFKLTALGAQTARRYATVLLG